MQVAIYIDGSYEGEGRLDYGMGYWLTSEYTFLHNMEIVLRTTGNQVFGRFRLKGSNYSGKVELDKVSDK